VSAFLKSKELQLGLLIIAFLIVFVPYFIPIPSLDWFSNELITITAIASAFTIVLAVYSQFRRGFSFINRRSRGWIFKAYMLVTLVLMLIFFVLWGQETGPYSWVMYAIITPLSSVNYSILVFYMASTGARAFRARNGKALLLLITGFIVLFYQAPLTGAIFPQITPAADYIRGTLVTAAATMFLISVTVGAIVFGMRVLMGKEPNVLGIQKEESS
jgi:hypothetical protein